MSLRLAAHLEMMRLKAGLRRVRERMAPKIVIYFSREPGEEVQP